MTDRLTKFIKSLDKKMKERLRKKLEAIKKAPLGLQGAKKLKGPGDNVFRLRVGKIRVIYEVPDGDVEIIDIDYRGNIY